MAVRGAYGGDDGRASRSAASLGIVALVDDSQTEACQRAGMQLAEAESAAGQTLQGRDSRKLERRRVSILEAAEDSHWAAAGTRFQTEEDRWRRSCEANRSAAAEMGVSRDCHIVMAVIVVAVAVADIGAAGGKDAVEDSVAGDIAAEEDRRTAGKASLHSWADPVDAAGPALGTAHAARQVGLDHSTAAGNTVGFDAAVAVDEEEKAHTVGEKWRSWGPCQR